jgi:hypothetical protein
MLEIGQYVTVGDIKWFAKVVGFHEERDDLVIVQALHLDRPHSYYKGIVKPVTDLRDLVTCTHHDRKVFSEK